jgi:hypothetical protein
MEFTGAFNFIYCASGKLQVAPAHTPQERNNSDHFGDGNRTTFTLNLEDTLRVSPDAGKVITNRPNTVLKDGSKFFY